MNDVLSDVADLRDRWHILHDLDRAQAVKVIHQSGISLRKLAVELNCSRSLLSRLLLAANASPEDLELARHVPMSTRELARKGKAEGISGFARHPEGIAFDLERAAVQGSRTILSWLDEDGISVHDQGPILVQIRIHLVNDSRLSQEEIKAALARALLDTITSLPRSARIDPDRTQSPGETALRLALWILQRIPDARVRARSLELAHGNLPNHRPELI